MGELRKMRCPLCEGEMVRGTAQVRGTWLAFLLVGLSLQDLIFDTDRDSSYILGSREKRFAYRCVDCKGFFILPMSAHLDEKAAMEKG